MNVEKGLVGRKKSEKGERELKAGGGMRVWNLLDTCMKLSMNKFY